MNIFSSDQSVFSKKRNFSDFWFVLASLFLSIITIKPSSLPSWLVSIFLVAPAFWFAFVGPKALNAWASNNRYVFASWLVFALKLLVVFAAVKFLASYATSLVSGWLNS